MSSRSPSTAFWLQRAARYHSPWALVIAAAGLAATFWVGRNTAQHYKSEAIILIQQYPGAPDPRQAGARLKDMLMTGDRLGQVVKDLNLFAELPSLQARVDRMRERVIFKIHPGSTVSIAMVAEHPEPAQRAAQQLAEGVMKDDERLRTLEAQRNRVFLDGERGRLQTEVKRREAELQGFLREHPEVAMQPEIEVVTSGDDGVRALEQELERLRQAQERAASGAGPEADSELVAARSRAEAELARSRQELSEKGALLTDAHPDVIVARQRVERAEDAYKRALAAESASRRAAAAGAGGMGASLAKQIEALEQKIASSRSAGRGSAARGRRSKQLVAPLQVEYQSLRHMLDEARERLSRLEEQQFQAEMLEKMQTDEGVGLLTVLDPAYLPAAPESNRRFRVWLVGGALSLLLGALAAFLRALSSDVIHDRNDVECLTGASVLAVVPGAAAQKGASGV